jgi:hypothetical protein
MRRTTGRAASGLAAVSLAATAVVTLVTPAAGVAAAAASDDYTLRTAGACGAADAREGYLKFVDNGPGAPGGGDNDDYFIVADTCGDNDGVKAWAWVDGVLKGDKYNGSGNGSKLVWDPIGNVKDGQSVGMKICGVDGNEGTPYDCTTKTITLHE